MSFQISPGINVSEIDLTTIVPVLATSDGAIGGVFRWGPVGQRVLVDSENTLLTNYTKPTNLNAETWLTAASFLNYGNRLHVSRAANTAGLSPRVTGTTVQSGNAVIAVSNTSALSVGMSVISASSSSVRLGSRITAINPDVSITLTTASDALATATATLQFTTNTVFTAFANSGTVENFAAQIVKNNEHFLIKPSSEFDSDVNFVARFPGELGNSLRVSVCANTTGYSQRLSLTANTYKFVGTATDVNGVDTTNIDRHATLNIPVGSNLVTVTVVETSSNGNIELANNTTLAAATTLQAQINVTDSIVLGKNTFIVTSVTAPVLTALSNTTAATASFTFRLNNRMTTAANGITITSNSAVVANNSFIRGWEFKNTFDAAPTRSSYQNSFGNTSVNSDQMHIVVVDNGGKFTGIPGTILETFKAVSRATDSKTVDGAKNFYKDVINGNSKYIYAINDISGAPSNTAINLTSSTLDIQSRTFGFGQDGADESTISPGDVYDAYDLFASPADIDVSLIMAGKLPTGTSAQLANYLVSIAEDRKDCVVFISPSKEDVVGKTGSDAADAIVVTRNLIDPGSSYAVMDSGYKYMYDRYNDIYRWVPLNGDIAGICARSDATNDPWWSPAGPARGSVKNVIRLAYNPSESERGTLYTNGVNPVVTFPGQGTLLYGDKTLLAVPSAFDRINVRRLFIVLEKAIARASESTLFEFNDAFTRSQFKNLVTPYLRDIQGRRGITDFLVVCDDSNNTPEVIDRNEFVGDIYIKPARSINFIQLNFVAVRTGIAFSEVVGQF
jgi:hypothetical protein